MKKELEEAFKYDEAMRFKEAWRKYEYREKWRNKLLSYDSVLPDTRVICSREKPIKVEIHTDNLPYKSVGFVNFIKSFLP